MQDERAFVQRAAASPEVEITPGAGEHRALFVQFAGHFVAGEQGRTFDRDRQTTADFAAEHLVETALEVLGKLLKFGRIAAGVDRQHAGGQAGVGHRIKIAGPIAGQIRFARADGIGQRKEGAAGHRNRGADLIIEALPFAIDLSLGLIHAAAQIESDLAIGSVGAQMEGPQVGKSGLIEGGVLAISFAQAAKSASGRVGEGHRDVGRTCGLQLS
jgi:hypothetical protein